jgi:sec-independent protein translocase protein TatA
MDPINVVVVAIVAAAVIFGSKKIPEVARSIGRAQGEFKKGLREGNTEAGTNPSSKTDVSE